MTTVSRLLECPDVACAICGGRVRIDQALVLIDADVMHARCYEATGARATPDLAGLTVVVADDDDDSRALVATLLEGRGARVLPARDGLGALILLETTPRVDALVTDLAMPQMDGLELVEKLRGHARAGSLPVIAVTGFAGHYANDEHAGFDAILAKPIDLERLCAALRTLARREFRGRAPTRPSSRGRQDRMASRGRRQNPSSATAGHSGETP